MTAKGWRSYKVHDRYVLFDGSFTHRTSSFVGRRFAVILFTHSAISRASHGQVKVLRDAGFRLEAIPANRSYVDCDTSDMDSDGHARDRPGAGNTGKGPHLPLHFSGKKRQFHDGAGLCSAGRWPPEARTSDSTGLGDRLRAHLMPLLKSRIHFGKALALLASGKCQASPFDAELVAEGRKTWLEAVASTMGSQGHGNTLAALSGIPPNQPYLLHGVGAHLRAVGDPDWKVFSSKRKFNYIDGVNLGVDERLPRCPALYERRTRQRRYHEEWLGHAESKENYRSVKGRVREIRKQFKKEAKDGLMQMFPKSCRGDILKTCGGDQLLVAALGALEKGDNSFRVLFDATHGVRFNPRTRPRDQIRNPGAREARTELGYYKSKGAKVFSLLADVRRAHRGFRVAAKDWKYQVCALSIQDYKAEGVDASTDEEPMEEDELWLNKVGTFGHSSASYWFGRLQGAVCRISVSLMATRPFFQLLYADDMKWSAAGEYAIDDLLLVLFMTELVGTPISWEKVRGGFEVEWVGLWLDYGRFSVGISEKRGLWLKKTLKAWQGVGLVVPGKVNECIGRFGFAFMALKHLRPFLGPFYAWLAVSNHRARLSMSRGLQLVAKFLEQCLVESLVEGVPPLRNFACNERVILSADARAEGEEVEIGGWRPAGDGSTTGAPWFSIKLTRRNASWAFGTTGEPFRRIASLELFATLLTVVLPAPTERECLGLQLRLASETDNLGNVGAVAKLMTTRYPLVAFLCELSMQVHKRGAHLDLQWVPRLQNFESDELSNGITSRFDPSYRVEVDLVSLEFLVLPQLLKLGDKLYRQIGEHKLQGRQSPNNVPMRTKRKRRPEEKLRATDPW